ncbi:MAG: DUF4331 domain-containing protein [Thermoleophilaceae bacterium]
MKKLSLLAAIAAAAIAVPLSIGSSHREAPNISLDPSADNTDTYAFTAKNAPGALTVVANWQPNQVANAGPNFYRFDDDARYYVNIDNTGDGRVDVRYRWDFKTTVRNRNSFLYALPGVKGFGDPKLNVIQRYNLQLERISRRGGRTTIRRSTIATKVPVAPSNVGTKTFPNYNVFTAGASRGLRGGGRTFAGQRDDPFFIDLGATFDGINIRKGTGNEGEGREDIAGTNTSAIVLQVPERQVTRNRRAVGSPKAGNSVVGVWASTDRRKLQLSNGNFDTRSHSAVGRRGARTANRFVQVSRLGVPLVNELVIPLGRKDQFNRTTPNEDAARYGKFAIKPELAAVLNALFKVNAPENNRTDIVQALLQGLPGLNEHKGFAKGKAPAVDTLKLNLGTPPAAGAENRFGVIGGDMAGFPNGRRLGDDVVDIELQVVAGFLKGNKVPLGDGVDRNDKAFGDTFPYLALPQPGNDAPGRTEESHAPVPAGGS